MSNKKIHLVKSLKLVIDALKNDTVLYNWEEQSSCNAGVVSQAILGVSLKELENLKEPLFLILENFNDNIRKEKDKINLTWKNSIKYSCSITGKNMPKIVADLETAGINRSDIVHLEFLENPAILELSGIEKELNKIPHKNLIKRFFGIKMITNGDYPEYYYGKKENLIKYLIAWVKILEENTIHENDRNNLEAKLLNAVAEENYVDAAKLRDQLLLI